jgi:hypothetical protein
MNKSRLSGFVVAGILFSITTLTYAVPGGCLQPVPGPIQGKPVPPVLDLDAHDSEVVGFGYRSSTGAGPTAPIAGRALITGCDNHRISRAVITIINPEPGDRLVQIPLAHPLTYDPASTDTRLIIQGTGSPTAYQLVIESIIFSNDLQDREEGLRLVSVIVEDVRGDSSNKAVTVVEVRDTSGTILRGYIFAEIRDALSSLPLDGAVVSISESHESLAVEELPDLYILDISPPGTYTVTASRSGYQTGSVAGVEAALTNDPSDPIPIDLNLSEADADVVPDGQLNVADLLVALRIVLGLKAATTIEIEHGDMNGDGQFTLSDYILIMQAIHLAT